MQFSNITLVSGTLGVGKTTWIRQQVNTLDQSAVYLNLGAGETAVDTTYLAAEVPGLTALSVNQLTDFLEQPFVECPIYIELGFHVDLTSLILPEQMAGCRRVAVLPPGNKLPRRKQRGIHSKRDNCQSECNC